MSTLLEGKGKGGTGEDRGASAPIPIADPRGSAGTQHEPSSYRSG